MNRQLPESGKRVSRRDFLASAAAVSGGGLALLAAAPGAAQAAGGTEVKRATQTDYDVIVIGGGLRVLSAKSFDSAVTPRLTLGCRGCGADTRLDRAVRDY